MTKLPERLLQLRLEQDFSQKSLVREMGLALNTYVRYERGEREPTASVLVQMADFYDVTLDYLVGRSDERK
ncbi:helix-turn-helix domain-containing protein [Flintibacter muris]|uniref:helix-turn-helix domain-containing protein n=1 Tax=Flintibacter muris TaxID=2941327 RepID=UPI00203A9C3A|nr:helix-turn-helix transcriptional regulator [Flintibacter muris]